MERNYAAQLLTSNAERVGYLLKDRVAQVEEFLDALERIQGAAPRSTRRSYGSWWSVPRTPTRWPG